MGKRKKKNRRQKGHTLPDPESDSAGDAAPVYQRAFSEADMLRLANEYRKRKSSEASLTLGIFADQYGIPVAELRAYLPDLIDGESDSVVLWHGTTKSRADSIIEEGFIAKGGRVFFARNTRIPLVIAQTRAANKNDRPVVIMCSIDLSRYNRYRRQGRNVYVFHHNHIGSEVVQEVMDAQSGKIRVKRESVELTDIGINFSSGQAGIAFWMNNYLNLNGADRIGEDHEAVGKIKEWLNSQAEAGRFGKVSDEEMQKQVEKHLPEYLP